MARICAVLRGSGSVAPERGTVSGDAAVRAHPDRALSGADSNCDSQPVLRIDRLGLFGRPASPWIGTHRASGGAPSARLFEIAFTLILVRSVPKQVDG